jgi:hypothetical protein
MLFDCLLLFAVGVSHGFGHLHHSLPPARLPLARFLLKDATFVVFLLHPKPGTMFVYTTGMFLLASAVDPDSDLMLVREKTSVVDPGCLFRNPDPTKKQKRRGKN